ncbi:hypothetical protein C0995_002183 [Termitomyces sp. Mi166|nr:hypothetical protein C0995_002183 [Termitomyces sp. Mi166\
MAVFTFFSYPSQSVVDDRKALDADKASEESKVEPTPEPAQPIATTVPTIVVSTPSSIIKTPSNPVLETVTPPKPRPSSHRFSLPLTRATDPRKPVHKQQKKSSIAEFLKCAQVSDKRAKKSALIVRDLIIGPSTSTSAHRARPQLRHLKSQLMEPKSANKVMAHLRALPASESTGTQGPIHAVCLARPDAEIQKLHFSVLSASKHKNKDDASDSFLNGLVSLDEVSSMFSKMNIVNLISHPTLGIGEPGDGPGLLSGAIPTAETVLKGFEEITPQLMALGYATGRSVLIDHTGVYPPTDRMSVLTYWWGLELVFPPPSLKHLASAHSVAGTVINFLSALALINNGVRELLPFIRYISQFIDFEFSQITQQDQGQGVVPRPWDFAPPPPPPPVSAPTPIDPPLSNANATAPPSQPVLFSPLPPTTAPTTTSAPASVPAPTVPSQPQPEPQSGSIISPSLSNMADSVGGVYKDSITFQHQVVAASSVLKVAAGTGAA